LKENKIMILLKRKRVKKEEKNREKERNKSNGNKFKRFLKNKNNFEGNRNNKEMLEM